MTGIQPPADFEKVDLALHIVGVGAEFGRIHRTLYPDPVSCGKAPSRFSDPRKRKDENRFGVLYLGESFSVCFLEALIRDRKDGKIGSLLIGEDELRDRLFSEVSVTQALKLVDLRGTNAIKMGVPSDVHRGSRHGVSRLWSLAFHEHSESVDGIIYSSRLNGETNIAVYDRSLGRLKAKQVRPLLSVSELAAVLDEMQIAIA